MFYQLFACVFLAFVTFSYSQYTSVGQCEDRTSLKAVEGFSLEGYSGDSAPWYPVITYSNRFDCQIVNFTLTDNVTMDMIYIQKNLTTGLWFSREGIVTWEPGTNKQGILSLVYPDVANPLVFKILGIDYVNYTIDYRCINLDSSNRQESIYVMSRTRNLTSEQRTTVLGILQKNGLNITGTLVDVKQDLATCSM